MKTPEKMVEPSAPPPIADMVATERSKLTEQRATLALSRLALDADIATIDKELAALDAYEAAKAGKTVRPASTPRQSSGAGRRPKIRTEVTDVIRSHQPAIGGLRRGDILGAMGIKGNKNAEMSVSNALTHLVKSGQVIRAGDGGYRVAA